MTNDDFIIMGQLGAPLGVRGFVKVNSFTQNIIDLLQYDPWYLQSKEGWQELKKEATKLHGKRIAAKFSLWQTPEEIKPFVGTKIGVKRTQLAVLAKNEYYWHDLIGLAVINKDGKNLGIITSLLETGSNDVLIVKSDITTIAIPYLSSSILKVDLYKKMIYIDWIL